MKTEKITVNKTAEQPDGVEIDLVMPDGAMEEKLLAFMLTLYLRDLKRDKRVNYELPERFVVDYRGQGRFVASDVTGGATYYEPPKPVCVVGLRWAQGRFDLIHAPLTPPAPTQNQTTPGSPAAASDAPSGEPSSSPAPAPEGQGESTATSGDAAAQG